MTTFRSAETHNANVRAGAPGELAVFDRPADKIRDNVQAQLDRLAADTAITDSARRQRRAKVLLDGRRSMAAEKARSDDAFAANIAKARRKVLGVDGMGSKTAADRVVFQNALRDARSRAEKVEDPKDLIDQLQTALEVGDDVEARGITAAALDKAKVPKLGESWVPVLDHYAQKRPDAAPALQDLLDLESSTEMSRNGFSFVLPTPSDLCHPATRQALSDGSLAQLAEGGDA